MLILTSMLSVPNVFVRPWDRQKHADKIKRGFCYPDSDHISLINVYKAFQANGGSQAFCKKSFFNIRALQQAEKIQA